MSGLTQYSGTLVRLTSGDDLVRLVGRPSCAANDDRTGSPLALGLALAADLLDAVARRSGEQRDRTLARLAAGLQKVTVPTALIVMAWGAGQATFWAGLMRASAAVTTEETGRLMWRACRDAVLVNATCAAATLAPCADTAQLLTALFLPPGAGADRAGEEIPRQAPERPPDAVPERSGLR